MPDVSTYNQTVKVMALCRHANVGPRLFELLMNRYGSLDAIFAAGGTSLHGIHDLAFDAAERVAGAGRHLAEAQAEYDALAGRDIGVVTRLNGTYPALLNELNDPPPLLYLRGQLPVNEGKTVTIVGTTEATTEGIELTVQAARRFAEAGVQVVSSLRVGIDASAHLGVKATGRGSFAIVEMGFDRIRAADQLPLAIDTLHAGGIISEYPPEAALDPQSYRQANRLLAGISHAVVITEIYRESRDLLDLVDFCGQIGKLVFLLTHPELGALADDETLDRLEENGAIPMGWPDDFDKIAAALV